MTTPAVRIPSAGSLLRVLGVAFGALMVVSNSIGSGILRTPGEVAAALPSPAWYLGIWVAGGLYALCGAMTMAELAAMIPKSGGQYVFARRAFGEYAGFVIGWTDWISSAGAIAAASIALGELVLALFPAIGISPSTVAVATTLAFGVVHWVGVKSGDVSTQVIGVLKVVTLLGVAIACFIASPVAISPEDAVRTVVPPALTFGAIILALQSVLYTYDGWNGVVYFSGEVKDPKLIPRSMALGVVTVTAVYVALASAFLYSLGYAALGGEKFAAKAAAIGIFGPVGERIVSAVIALSLLGNAGAVLMLTARVPFAMAMDGLLPRAVTRVNRGGTPDIGLLLGVAVTLVLIATGSFTQVVALSAFFYVMQYGVTFTALFVLRRREPDTERPYRAIGYPFVPALVLLGAIAFIAGNFISDRANTLRSVGVLVLSYPVYRAVVFARKRAS